MYFINSDLTVFSSSRIEKLRDRVITDNELPDELLYGRCGYLSALLFLKKYIGKEAVKSETIIKVNF